MNAQATIDPSPQNQSQRRNIWLTVTACLVFITILLGLFFHKITTPRYLSTIELRVNGLVLLKQPRLFLERQEKAEEAADAIIVARQLLTGKWSLLVSHAGRCDTGCIEKMTHVMSMLTELKQAYREKTQWVLISDNATELLAIINKAGLLSASLRQIEPIVVIDTPQRQVFESAIERVVGSAVEGTTKSNIGSINNRVATTTRPTVIIVDNKGDYRGYFTAPFDHNKMLLTYSSVIEHR